MSPRESFLKRIFSWVFTRKRMQRSKEHNKNLFLSLPLSFCLFNFLSEFIHKQCTCAFWTFYCVHALFFTVKPFVFYFVLVKNYFVFVYEIKCNGYHHTFKYTFTRAPLLETIFQRDEIFLFVFYLSSPRVTQSQGCMPWDRKKITGKNIHQNKFSEFSL